jgi:hypothetical protein
MADWKRRTEPIMTLPVPVHVAANEPAATVVLRMLLPGYFTRSVMRMPGAWIVQRILYLPRRVSFFL